MNSAPGYILSQAVNPQPALQYHAYQQGLYSAYPAHYGFPAYSSTDYGYSQVGSYGKNLYDTYGGQYGTVYGAQGALANPIIYTYTAYNQPLQYSGPAPYNAPPNSAYSLQAPPHLMPYSGPTAYHAGLTAMPQYTPRVVAIHTAVMPSPGYSVPASQITPSQLAQGTMQQIGFTDLSSQKGCKDLKPSAAS